MCGKHQSTLYPLESYTKLIYSNEVKSSVLFGNVLCHRDLIFYRSTAKKKSEGMVWLFCVLLWIEVLILISCVPLKMLSGFNRNFAFLVLFGCGYLENCSIIPKAQLTQPRQSKIFSCTTHLHGTQRQEEMPTSHTRHSGKIASTQMLF